MENVIYDCDTLTCSLICTSFGGPVTAVSWKKIGTNFTESTYPQTQMIVSTENATYKSILRIPDVSIENYDATYECLVSNSRGNDPSVITLEGKCTVIIMLKVMTIQYMFHHVAVEIVHWNLTVSHIETLVCITAIEVDEIEWLDSDGEAIVTKSSTKELHLIFVPVNASINNRHYTCRANKSGSVNRTVTLSVGGK